MRFYDPTPGVEKKAPTTTGVMATAGEVGTTATVKFNGKSYAALVLGESVAAGETVNIVILARDQGGSAYVMPTSGAYPTSFPRRLADWGPKFKASTALRQLLENNPKSRKYRPVVATAFDDETGIATFSGGEAPVMFGAVDAGISAGDATLLYQTKRDRHMIGAVGTFRSDVMPFCMPASPYDDTISGGSWFGFYATETGSTKFGDNPPAGADALTSGPYKILAIGSRIFSVAGMRYDGTVEYVYKPVVGDDYTEIVTPSLSKYTKIIPIHYRIFAGIGTDGSVDFFGEQLPAGSRSFDPKMLIDGYKTACVGITDAIDITASGIETCVILRSNGEVVIPRGIAGALDTVISAGSEVRSLAFQSPTSGIFYFTAEGKARFAELNTSGGVYYASPAISFLPGDPTVISVAAITPAQYAAILSDNSVICAFPDPPYSAWSTAISALEATHVWLGEESNSILFRLTDGTLRGFSTRTSTIPDGDEVYINE